jgi:hypothetical protein
VIVRLLLVLLVATLLATGCASPPRGLEGARDVTDTPPPSAQAEDEVADADVRVDAAGTAHLLVRDRGALREIATFPAGDGEVVHTAVRPGPSDPLTVLVLLRCADPDQGTRYELRYAVEHRDGGLEQLPEHLQVDGGIATVLDVPPLPVWSPDGSALAWVEWNPLGTQLRAVGWDVERTGPASEAVAYRLDEVPPGVQLDGWEDDSDGVAVLTGRRDGERWRIAVEQGPQRLALTRGRPVQAEVVA